MRFNDLTYWEELETVASHVFLNAEQVCKIASIPKSTESGLRAGAEPRPATRRKLLGVLKKFGWSGIKRHEY